jgi:hypothetical protein
LSVRYHPICSRKRGDVARFAQQNDGVVANFATAAVLLESFGRVAEGDQERDHADQQDGHDAERERAVDPSRLLFRIVVSKRRLNLFVNLSNGHWSRASAALRGTDNWLRWGRRRFLFSHRFLGRCSFHMVKLTKPSEKCSVDG